MKSFSKKAVLFNAALALFALTGTACQAQKAQSECEEQFDTPAEVSACVHGRVMVAAVAQDAETGQKMCQADFDVAKLDRTQIEQKAYDQEYKIYESMKGPKGETEEEGIHADATAAGQQAYFDEVRAKTDQYNACVAGMNAHLEAIKKPLIQVTCGDPNGNTNCPK